MGRPLWQLLLLETQEADPSELTCQECLSLFDYYIDWMRAGGDWHKLRASIINHVSHCSDCRQDLERRLDEWAQFSKDQGTGP